MHYVSILLVLTYALLTNMHLNMDEGNCKVENERKQTEPSRARHPNAAPSRAGNSGSECKYIVSE